MKDDLYKHNLTFLGFALPSVWLGAVVFLILISFVNSEVSSIISAENLILLTLIFSPVICIAGATISIIALATSEMKKRPLLAAGLNIALLVCWLCFDKFFLMDLVLIG